MPSCRRFWGRARASRSVNPLGAVFVSYRFSDARDVAEDMAWLLRAFGVPVWQDKIDLPPGDIDRRLDEALASGLSGGLLVVSPEAGSSKTIRRLEAPRLLDLAKSGKFTFAVGSLLIDPATGDLDHKKPDKVLRLGRAKLSNYKQYNLANLDGRVEAARSLAFQRMKLLHNAGVVELGIDLQTRAAPIGRQGPFPLMIRARPPVASGRVLSKKAWEELAAGLRDFSNLVENSGAARVTITGGAHLSAAFALGAALPVTCRWPITVRSQDGRDWTDSANGSGDLSPKLNCKAEELTSGGDRIAVLVDLVDTEPRTDVFDSRIAIDKHLYSRALWFSLATRRRVEASEGYAIARLIMADIRKEASQARTSKIALFLLAPFPLAVILGRLANTLEIELHEWDDSSDPPHYQPVVTVRCGHADGPITDVLCR